MTSTLDTILQEVLASMPIELNIYAVEADGDNYKCYCLNTFYLTVDSPITLNGVKYKVVSFVQDEHLILSGASGPSVDSYEIPNFNYYWGRFNQVNVETAREKEIDLMPMLWRFDLEPRTDLSFTDSINNSEGNTRLFFLQTTDLTKYTTENDYTNVLDPLEGYVNSFVTYLMKHRLVGKLGTVTRLKHPKFLDSNGSVGKVDDKFIFNKKISAIEVTIALPIRKDLTCKTKFIPIVEGKGFGSGFNSVAFN